MKKQTIHRASILELYYNIRAQFVNIHELNNQTVTFHHRIFSNSWTIQMLKCYKRSNVKFNIWITPIDNQAISLFSQYIFLPKFINKFHFFNFDFVFISSTWLRSELLYTQWHVHMPTMPTWKWYMFGYFEHVIQI